MVMLSAGNLSISQQVREILQIEELDDGDRPPMTIWNATSMFDAARVLGAAVRRVYDQDGAVAQEVRSRLQRLDDLRRPDPAARRCACSSSTRPATSSRRRARRCFFQIGESKYGKPVLDRMIRPSTPLDEAAKCVLVSMDSTLKSNLSVGLPLDLADLRGELRFESSQIVCIDERNPYFQMIRSSWGEKLRQAFECDRRPAVGCRPVGGGAAVRAVAALRNDA